MSRNLSRLLVVAASLAPSWATYVSLTKPKEDRYPVAKVVDLLQDMQKQLAKEAAEDETIYNKVTCHCQTGSKEKTKSIADAKAKIEDLSTEIEELKAGGAKLGIEKDKITKELAAQDIALKQVFAMRDKEVSAFKKEEREMLSSISALSAAVAVLKKPVGDSFLEQPRGHAVRAMLRRALDEHAALLDNVLEPSALRAVVSFVQAPDNSYKPQSGEILGVLEEMLVTFQENLEMSQKGEKKALKAFEGLKAAKKAQIAASQKQANDKIKAKSNADKKKAEAETDLVDTKKALAADEALLKKLVEKCKATDEEYEERLKTRQAEMSAVSEANAILNSDEARDMFSATLKPKKVGLLQKESSVRSARRTQASEFLSTAARRFHSSQLSALAYSVRLDAFTQVKKSIDELVSQLLEDQSDEKKQKDFCDNEFKENKVKTEKKTREKKDLSARIDALKTSIENENKAIGNLKAEVEEMQRQLKEAGEDREEENKSFQQNVAEQRETQKLLKAALRILKKYYDQKGAAFIQDGEQDGNQPVDKGLQDGDARGYWDAANKAYVDNQKSGSVMDLLQQIIADGKKLEVQATSNEKEAQKSYEDLVAETNKSIKAKTEAIVNKAEAKGKSEVEVDEVKNDKEGVEDKLGELEDFKAELHEKCDFLVKNFKVRQASRKDEIEALKQAKAILSGAKFKEFLQRA